MAAASVYKLAWVEFDAFVARTPIVLLAVSEFSGRNAPEKVTAFFSGMYGDDFAAATIAVSEVPYRPWLTQRLVPALPNATTFAEGLYLFLGGTAARYHEGFNLPAWLLEIAALVVTDGRVQYESDVHAKDILDMFAPAAAEFMRGRQPASPPPENVPSEEQKARQDLGVSPQATDSEIDKAWRRRRGEYAPDRVQHVGEAFVRLAHEKILEIDRAYEVLRRRRSE